MNCFTIGHSIHPLSKFLKFLASCNINCIADVRGIPYIKYASQFNKEYLQSEIKQKNINYLFMGDVLGATDYASLKSEEGGIDFKKALETKEFTAGIERIIEEIKKGSTIAIMCTDKEPLSCHRFALVSRALALKGIIVNHILKHGTLCSNDELENRLLEKYQPDYKQASQSPARQEALEKAYHEQSKQLTCDSK